MDSLDWGYVLIGPGRPEREVQRRVMKYAGCDISDVGTVWQDTLPARATRPMSALVERNLLLGAVKAGDRVHAATLLCLGVSGDDVRQVLSRLSDTGVTTILHDDSMRELAPGDDLEVLAVDFNRMRNALHVRRARAKKRKSD